MYTIDFDQKYNLKIRDKETGKFVSPTYNNKKTWNRLHDVFNKFKHADASQIVNHLPKHPSKYEVALFPLNEGITMEATDFIEQYRIEKVVPKQQKERAKKIRKQNARQEANDILQEMQKLCMLPKSATLSDVEAIVSKNILKEEYQQKLENLITWYNQKTSV